MQLSPFRAFRYDDPSSTPEEGVIDLSAVLRENAGYSPSRLLGATTPVDGDREWLSWVEQGIVAQDAVPALYVYRSGWHDPSGTPRRGCGVIGLSVSVNTASTSTGTSHFPVSPSVMPVKEGINHQSTPEESPVVEPFLVHIDEPALAELLMTAATSMPLARTTDSSGAHHRLWAVTQSIVIETVVDLVAPLSPPARSLVAISPDGTGPPTGFVFTIHAR